MSTNNENIWILNSTYNDTFRRHQELEAIKAREDQKVINARNSLHQADSELEKESSLARVEVKQRLDQAGKELDEKLANLAEEFYLELGRQNIWLKDQMDRMRRDVADVERNMARVDHKVKEVAQEFDRRFQRILTRIDHQKERAVVYQQQLRVVYGNINTLHPDKLAPDETELISNTLEDIDIDIRNEDYEAAISLAQNKMPEAMLLQARLEVMNDEYAQEVVAIHDLCRDMSNRVEDLKQPGKNIAPLKYNDVDGEFDGRINFWSNGLFDTLIGKYEHYCDLLLNEYEPEMETVKIRETNKELEQINRQIAKCVELAHDEYYEFCRVSDLAVRIYQVLTNKDSWKLMDSGFVNNDVRRAYSMVFYNGGDMVGTVVVMQSRENIGKNRKGEDVYGPTQFRVMVNSNKGIDDIKRCEITREGIIARLAEEGIELGYSNASCNSGEMDNRNPDVLIEQYIAESDKIKNGRVANARMKMGI